MVKDFKIIDFIGCNSSVESNQKGFEEGFSSFQIEVHDLNPEKERDERTFHDPVDIDGRDSNTQGSQTGPESNGEFSSHHEIFIVRRHLFWSHEIVE